MSLVDHDHRVGDDAAYVVDANLQLPEFDTKAIADGCIDSTIVRAHQQAPTGKGG
jgi:hypothetical protein